MGVLKFLKYILATSLTLLASLFALYLLGGYIYYANNGGNGTLPTETTAPPAQATQAVAHQNSVSANWSGYIADKGTYTGVGATWNVPEVEAQNYVTSADATWVGIGGVSSNDLIQAGTQAITNSQGYVTYQAWFELLPGRSQTIPLSVKPGDRITVTLLKEKGNLWLISFINNTSGKKYQTSAQYTSSLDSAEWIEEMPVGARSFIPLDNFGSIDFSNAFVIKNGQKISIAQAGSYMTEMVNNQGQSLATPSRLQDSGTSFSVARTDASPTITFATAGRTRIRRIYLSN